MMELCIECKKETSWGTGNFCNRSSSNDGALDGFLCADCQSLECDRCHKKTTEYQLDGEVICMECIADAMANQWSNPVGEQLTIGDI